MLYLYLIFGIFFKNSNMRLNHIVKFYMSSQRAIFLWNIKCQVVKDAVETISI